MTSASGWPVFVGRAAVPSPEQLVEMGLSPVAAEPGDDGSGSTPAQAPAVRTPPLAVVLVIVAGLLLAGFCGFTALMPADAAVGIQDLQAPHNSLVLPAPAPLRSTPAPVGTRKAPGAGPGVSGTGGGTGTTRGVTTGGTSGSSRGGAARVGHGGSGGSTQPGSGTSPVVVLPSPASSRSSAPARPPATSPSPPATSPAPPQPSPAPPSQAPSPAAPAVSPNVTTAPAVAAPPSPSPSP